MSEHVSTATARHSAIAADLLAEIVASFPVGSRFSTEMELQKRFGVGRHTVREALKVLAEQGVLSRRRKIGTVVLAHRPVSPYIHSLRDVRSLFDFAKDTRLDIAHEGYVSRSGSRLIDAGDDDDRRWLRLAGPRSTRADGEPLCWSEILVPERFAPDREACRAGDRAIYELVLERHELKLDYVEQEISARALPRAFARLLRSDDETAALMVRRRYVAVGGATFEISHNLYPANRYSVRSVVRQRA